MERLAWLCRVPEGLGEDSSSESLSKGTSSGRGSPSAGPGAISRPEPEIEMCRQGWDPGSASMVVSSSAGASTSSSGPEGSKADSGGPLREADRSLRMKITKGARPHPLVPKHPPGSTHNNVWGGLSECWVHLPGMLTPPTGPHRWQRRCRPGTAPMQRMRAEQTAMQASTSGSARRLSRHT